MVSKISLSLYYRSIFVIKNTGNRDVTLHSVGMLKLILIV